MRMVGVVTLRWAALSMGTPPSPEPGPMAPGTRVAVAHLGPDPVARGGMSAVLRALFDSPLSERYVLEMIPTYRSRDPLQRLIVFLRAMALLVRWCAGDGRRIVHVHTTVRGSLYRKSVLVAVAKLMRRPVVLHLHAGAGDISEFDARIGPVRRALFKRAFRAADRVLSVSQASATEIERRLTFGGVLVVPNAAPSPAASEFRRDGHEGVNILYLGGFANQAKGGDVLAETLPQLVRDCPGVHVTMAGPGEPPASLQPLLEGGAVRWRGWLDEPFKAEELGRCDIFVLPSISEGLPVALLEAMSWGRAIVATRVGGVPEVLSDGIDSALVDPRRPDQLATRLASLVADGAERARLGAAARARAKRLNADEVCGRLDAVYQELA